MKNITYKNQEKKHIIFAHNNSYGNYAGKYKSQCLPNISDVVNGISETFNYAGSVLGCFKKEESAWKNRTPQYVDATYSGILYFDATRSNSIYRDYFNANMSRAFTV